MTSHAKFESASGREFTLRNFSLLLAVVLVAWRWPIFFGGESFIYRDFGYFGYPLAFHHRASFWDGVIPLWNPLNHCGIPFLAQWNTMVLYPGSFLYLLLPLEFSLSFFCLIHLWLAGVGMFLLAHSFYQNGFAAAFAGLAFAINGLSLNFLLWPNNVAALAWMPFVIWLGLRIRCRVDFLAATAAASLQMLTGAPEVILLTWAIFLALAAVRCATLRNVGPLKQFALLCLVVAAVCAAQLLPFLDLVQISQRHRDFGGSLWSMPLWGWASFAVPQIFTYILSSGVRFQYDQLWTSSYYPAIAVTLLALSRLVSLRRNDGRDIALGGIAILAVILSMGPAAHAYSFFKAVIPGFGLMRFPIKFVIATLFALPLLAAAALARTASPTRTRSVTFTLVAVGAAGMVAYARFYPKYEPPFDNWPLTFHSAVVALLFAALALALWGKPNRWAHWALLALIPVEIFLQIPNPSPTIPRAALMPSPSADTGRAMLSREVWEKLYLETLPDTHANFLHNRAALNANLNLLAHAPKIDGFFSLNTSHAEALRNQLYARGQENLATPMDLMGVSRLAIPSSDGRFNWITRTNPLPLVTAGQSPRTLPEADLLPALFWLQFKPRQMALFPSKFSGYSSNAVPATVNDIGYGAHCVEFEVEAASPTLAVISSSFHPNWRAHVNGQPRELLRANFAFMAVPVPQGNSKVILEYEDRAFQFGLFISAAAILGLVGLALKQ